MQSKQSFAFYIGMIQNAGAWALGRGLVYPSFLVRTGRMCNDRLYFAQSNHQNTFRFVCGFSTKMFDLRLISVAQIIKAQAVLFSIHQ